MSDEQTKPDDSADNSARIDSAAKLDAWLNKFSSSARDALNDNLAAHPALYQVVSTNKEGWWLRREVARGLYDFGQVYHALPNAVAEILSRWEAMPLPYHFAHLSNLDASKIAYTPSWEDGVADRQLQISLGKYIKKHFPHVPEFVIKEAQEFLNNLLQKATVKFATDFNKIFEIYRSCSPACMSKSVEHYNRSNLHPLRAYEGPGFAVAYLQPGGDGTRYTARSMVWDNPNDEKDKRYVRVYGDMLLAAQLDKLGYRRTNFAGARLKRVDFHEGGTDYVLVPYIDDHSQGRQGTGTTQAVKVLDNWVEITGRFEHGAVLSNAEGRIKAPVWAPELYQVLTFTWLESDIPSYSPPKSGITKVVYYYDRGMENVALGVFRFRTEEDVARHTIALIDGGRLMADYNSFTAFNIMEIRGAEGVGIEYELANRPGFGSKYRQLSAENYTAEVLNRRANDRPYRPRGVFARKEHAKEGLLAVDARTVTHGCYTGTLHHRRNVFADPLNREHFYHISDAAMDYTGRYFPRQFAAELDHRYAGDHLFDNRVVKVHEKSKLPIRHPVFCAASVALGSAPSDYALATHDALVLIDRERGIPTQSGSPLIPSNAEWLSFQAGRLFLAKLVLTERDTFEFSYEKIEQDHRRMVADCDVKAEAYKAVFVARMNRSVPKHTNQGFWFDRETIEQIRVRLLELSRKALNRLDNSSAAADTLQPQLEASAASTENGTVQPDRQELVGQIPEIQGTPAPEVAATDSLSF